MARAYLCETAFYAVVNRKKLTAKDKLAKAYEAMMYGQSYRPAYLHA